MTTASGPLRIGTWNLAGSWTDRHRDLLLRQDCGVWLLTEVSERLSLPGYSLHATCSRMADDRFWAAVVSRVPMAPAASPHVATAAVEIDGTLFVSSVLPWRSAGDPEVWGGHTHAEKTAATLQTLERFMKGHGVVWGGDWNLGLQGPEYAGSMAGRREVQGLLERLDLVAPTGPLPHRLDEPFSIDHVAVPADVEIAEARRVVAEVDGRRLSDHDMYVVDVAPAADDVVPQPWSVPVATSSSSWQSPAQERGYDLDASVATETG